MEPFVLIQNFESKTGVGVQFSWVRGGEDGGRWCSVLQRYSPIRGGRGEGGSSPIWQGEYLSVLCAPYAAMGFTPLLLPLVTPLPPSFLSSPYHRAHVHSSSFPLLIFQKNLRPSFSLFWSHLFPLLLIFKRTCVCLVSFFFIPIIIVFLYFLYRFNSTGKCFYFSPWNCRG